MTSGGRGTGVDANQNCVGGGVLERPSPLLVVASFSTLPYSYERNAERGKECMDIGKHSSGGFTLHRLCVPNVVFSSDGKKGYSCLWGM